MSLRVLVYSLFIALAIGFALGFLYERQIAFAELQRFHVNAAKIRSLDWKLFSQHVKDDQRKFGNNRFAFPSMTSNDLQRFALKLVKFQKNQTHTGNATYFVEASFKNIKGVDEYFSPVDVKIIDEQGNTYDPYLVNPSLAKVVFSSGSVKVYKLFYHLPASAIPQKLVLIGSSGISQFSLVPYSGPYFDPFLNY